MSSPSGTLEAARRRFMPVSGDDEACFSESASAWTPVDSEATVTRWHVIIPSEETRALAFAAVSSIRRRDRVVIPIED